MFGFVKRWRVGLLGATISVLVGIFVASEINFELLGNALKTADFIYLLPGVVLLVAGLVARAFRWRFLLTGDLPVGRAFHIMNIAYLVNGVLPLRIGELARAYLASRGEASIPIIRSLSTVIVERLLDVLAIVVMVAVALMSGPVPDELRATGVFFGLIGCFGFLFLVVVARHRNLAHGLLSFFVQRLPVLRRFDSTTWLNHFLDGLLPLTQIRTLLGTIIWTTISWGLSATAGYILMLMFYDRADWVATCLYIAAASFAIAVPITLGNLGVYEASIVLVLMALDIGESETQAVAFAIVVHATNVGINVVTGIIGFIAEGITLGQLSQGVQKMTEGKTVEGKEVGEYA